MSNPLAYASTFRRVALPGHKAKTRKSPRKEVPKCPAESWEKTGNNPKVVSRNQLKSSLSSNKDRLKALVLKKIPKEELLTILNKKRELEKAFQGKRQLNVCSDSSNNTTEEISKRFYQNSYNAGRQQEHICEREKLYVELSMTTLNAIVADRVVLYFLQAVKEILKPHYCWTNSVVSRKSMCTPEVSPVATHVAATRQSVLLKDATQDRRFNNRSVVNNELSVICIPLINVDKELVGVIELSRGQERPPFTEKHYRIAEGFIVWACLGINQVMQKFVNKQKKKLNTFLLDVTNDIFYDVRQLHNVMAKTMTHSKALVGAERCAVAFLDKLHSELCVTLRDVGEQDSSGQPVYSNLVKSLRFPVSESFIQRIASSGNIFVHDKMDQKFTSCVKVLSELCNVEVRNMIYNFVVYKGETLGMLAVLNKPENETFCEEDVEMLKVFGGYFSIALNYSKIYSEMKVKEDCANVAIEQLQSQAMKQDKSLGENLMKNPITKDNVPQDIYSHLFSIEDNIKSILDSLFIFMVHDLFGNILDEVKLCSFTEAVYRNYRTVPYHNWQHAFYVSHCMYIVLKDPIMVTGLTELERLGLLIACICHDLDHRGYNNTFFEKLNLPLAALYSTSVMEQHHFHTTVLILQQDSNTIFDHFSTEQYQEMLAFIRHAIISTDLSVYFGLNKPKLEGLVKSQTFDVSNPEHKDVMIAVTMTACDLCAAAKPWTHQVKSVKALYDEFYVQGDIEKDRGFEPIAMMNRENNEKLADQQSGFMKFVAVPLYSTLGKVIPVVKEIEATVNANLENWIRIGMGETIPPWEPSMTSTIGTDTAWAHKESLRSVKSLFPFNEAENINQKPKNH